MQPLAHGAYRDALLLARTLMFGYDVTDPDSRLVSPVVDLAALFETLLERATSLALDGTGIEVRRQASNAGAVLDGTGRPYVRPRPDLVLLSRGTPVCVLDAKYKPRYVSHGPGLSAQNRVSHADLYQMFFYSRRTARSDGVGLPVFIVAPLLPGAEAPAERLRQISWSGPGASALLRVHDLDLVRAVRAVVAGDVKQAQGLLQPVLETVLDAIPSNGRPLPDGDQALISVSSVANR